MPARRSIGFVLAALALGCVLALAAAELALRLLGREVWSRRQRTLDRPAMIVRAPDAVRGWRNRPGSYDSPYGKVTILADGSRATSRTPPQSDRKIVFIGGSFTFGQSVADEETFAWQLQGSDPSRRYLNYGVGAYGSYQALLTLEELLAAGLPPDVVVYGYISHHQTRNVAATGWVRALSTVARAEAPALPYCVLREDGSLERRPPLAYPVWPLRETIVLPSFIGDRWLIWSRRREGDRRRAVTQALLRELRDVCRDRGIRFVVALLDVPRPGGGWEPRFLAAEGIETANCHMSLGNGLAVPRDGHPNGKGHARFAQCLAEALGFEAGSNEE